MHGGEALVLLPATRASFTGKHKTGRLKIGGTHATRRSRQSESNVT